MRRLSFVGLCLLFALAAQGQTVTISAANLQIDPAGSDSYFIRGSFSGISFGGAKLVLLSVGQFQASILMTDLVQQPGANIFVYQDRSGQAPYWLSSLALDLDAQTFTAEATGITLAGLPNPFAIQFGNESAYGCVMARVRLRARRRVMRVRAAAAADAVTFQLAAGDGSTSRARFPRRPRFRSRHSSPASQSTSSSTSPSFPRRTSTRPACGFSRSTRMPSRMERPCVRSAIVERPLTATQSRETMSTVASFRSHRTRPDRFPCSFRPRPAPTRCSRRDFPCWRWGR